MAGGKSIVHDVGGGDGEEQQTIVCRGDTVRVAVLLIGIAVASCLLILHMSASPIGSPPLIFNFTSPFSTSISLNHADASHSTTFETELDAILSRASGGDKNRTVILTNLNKAWAEPNSIFDLFLESFRVGEGTEELLQRLVVVCMDKTAYSRCSRIKRQHHHCYFLRTRGIDFSGEQAFMSPDYLKMMWRRIRFLGSVLQLGYSFLFTDADIMWLRDPFPRLFPEADFQIACDRFNGNPEDIRNDVNGGFTYGRSNNRTIQFYNFWYSSRLKFPGQHDQDVFNNIKLDPFIAQTGLRMRFLNTAYFGGFCEPSQDLNLVRTMHANCCKGLENKIKDLRQVLDVWSKYSSAGKHRNRSVPINWGDFYNCRRSMGN